MQKDVKNHEDIGAAAAPDWGRLQLKKRQGSTMTVTWNEQVLVFPAAAVAVQVTVGCIPRGKKEPDGGVQTVVTGKQSKTVGGG